MQIRTSLPPAPTEPRTAILHVGTGRAYGRVERCGPGYLVVRTTLHPALGDTVRVRIPSTCFGELSVETTVRWHEPEGRLGLQLGSLRPRDLVALRRLVPEPAPDARLAARRRGYQVDARLDPFAPQPDRTLPYDGTPVSIFLVNGEVEGVATTLEEEHAVVHAGLDLHPGAHVVLRVYEDSTEERWSDRPMVVLASDDGVLQLVPQRERWAGRPS